MTAHSSAQTRMDAHPRAKKAIRAGEPRHDEIDDHRIGAEQLSDRKIERAAEHDH